MTKDEAEKAAATFEFPPFRADALRTWIFTDSAQPLEHGYHEWGLHVFGPFDATATDTESIMTSTWFHCYFDTAQKWLDFYAKWPREQRKDGAAS